MRTSRIATVLLALAPTAILGSPVSIPKDGIVAIDHSLTPSKTTNLNHGLAGRDDHNPSIHTDVHPGDMCINAHATEICTPGGEDNPNWNQNTKRSPVSEETAPDPDSDWACSYNAAGQYECTGDPDHETCVFDEHGDPTSCTAGQKKIATPIRLAHNVNHGLLANRDTLPTALPIDPNHPWVCGYNAAGQYECAGGPNDESCLYDEDMNRTCTKNNKMDLKTTTIDAAAAINTVKARNDGDPYGVWDCKNTALRQYICSGGPNNETCTFDDGSNVFCISNTSANDLFKTSSRDSEDGGDPDFSCVTDVTGDYVCTGADVRCVIGKQGNATCSFNGPDGSDASKYKVNEEHLAMVLSTVGPNPKNKDTQDDSDPFDVNPNYSCTQIADYTWSCGSNGISPPGSGNGKGKGLDNRGSGDPGQGCNQPQGFFGGCDGKRASEEKSEVDEIPDDPSPGNDSRNSTEAQCLYITDEDAVPYPSGFNDCRSLYHEFLSSNNTLWVPDPDIHSAPTNPDDFVLSWSTGANDCKKGDYNTCHIVICNYNERDGWPVKLAKKDIKQRMKEVLDTCVGEQQVGGWIQTYLYSATLTMGALETVKLAEIERQKRVDGKEHVVVSNEKREPEDNTGLAIPEEDEKKSVNVEGQVAERGDGDPGQGCSLPQGFFGGCDGKLATTKREEMFVKVVKKSADDEKPAVVKGDEKDADDKGRDGWHSSCFFGGCNEKDIIKREEIEKVREKLGDDDMKNVILVRVVASRKASLVVAMAKPEMTLFERKVDGMLTATEQDENKAAGNTGPDDREDNPDENCSVVESFFWYC
ncbi:hypothetical protein B0T09DRAFT_299385 [Sordaria sp. MPI-SDFR-AT-0083]|nr:hypothetical protein B0T09DRAFT_299385 [Sordaria sp. MPI-SDFR-AT-0083]